MQSSPRTLAAAHSQLRAEACASLHKGAVCVITFLFHRFQVERLRTELVKGRRQIQARNALLWPLAILQYAQYSVPLIAPLLSHMHFGF